MEEIGPTVKKIRIIKGFTQKEVYAAVISRSFANRFERGLNDVSAAKLFIILDHLSISVDEFRFIQNNYQQTIANELQTQLNKAYDSHDLQQLGQIVAANKQSANLSLRSLAATGEILIESYYSKTVSITPEINNFWDKLFASKTWTIHEIKLAVPLFIIATSTGQIDLIPKMVNQFEINCKKYISNGSDPFGMLDELLNMYLAVFQIQLNLGQFEEAQNLAQKVDAIDPHTLSANSRISQQLIKGISQLYFGNQATGEHILQTIEAFESLYSPAIDHNVIEIIDVRRKLAGKYRKMQGESD